MRKKLIAEFEQIDDNRDGNITKGELVTFFRDRKVRDDCFKPTLYYKYCAKKWLNSYVCMVGDRGRTVLQPNSGGSL